MYLKMSLVILISILMSDCSGNHTLREVSKQAVKKQTVSSIKPVPNIKKLQPVIYQAHSLRDPFQKIKNDRDEKKREFPLEQFQLNLLKAVGTLRQGRQIWVLFETPTGKVYSAKTGTRIGDQNGKITKINESGAMVVQNHQTIYLKFNKEKAC